MTTSTNHSSALLEFFNRPLNDMKSKETTDCSTSPTRTEITFDDDSCDNDFVSQQKTILIPPDLISASTSSGDDGSVSSLSSDDCTNVRRSIFGPQIEKSPKKFNKQRRTRPFPKTSSSMPSCPYSCESDDEVLSEGALSGNTYENTLKKEEGVQLASPSGRRSIFGACLTPQRSQSFHDDGKSCFVFNPPTRMRQAFSDSSLVIKTGPSCLRSSKYSGDAERNIDRSTPVSFSERVTVIKYETPQEQWAPSGWSNYFH